jgi:chitinase
LDHFSGGRPFLLYAIRFHSIGSGGEGPLRLDGDDQGLMMSLRRIVVLAAVFLFAEISVSAQQHYRVIGYYTMWGRSNLPASAVRFNDLTHINHAFAWPDTNGGIVSVEAIVDTAIINTTHRAGRKILLSCGGAGAVQTTNFAIVAADSARRRAFVDNVVAHLAVYHYDGIDLDWEGPSSLAERANEVALVQELRAAFRATDTTWLITMAIGASSFSGLWHDYASLVLSVDWFNAMEYDFHGSWSQVAGHNAPLYVGSDPTADPDHYSIDQSISYLTVDRAIPKEKLVLGLPFYGKSFGTSTLYTSYAGEQELAYRDIVSAVQTGSWTYVWDDGSMAPYYTSVSPPRLISFDDSASIATKCQYTRNEGLSGVMIWELSQDVIGQDQLLMDVVGAQMGMPTRVPEPPFFALYDNYPNPFSARGGSAFGGNPSTAIRFAIPAAAHVSLKVFDMLGREVATLLDEDRTAGVGTVLFNASRYDLASGVYFYRIQVGTFTQTKKMILMR